MQKKYYDYDDNWGATGSDPSTNSLQFVNPNDYKPPLCNTVALVHFLLYQCNVQAASDKFQNHSVNMHHPYSTIQANLDKIF